MRRRARSLSNLTGHLVSCDIHTGEMVFRRGVRHQEPTVGGISWVAKRNHILPRYTRFYGSNFLESKQADLLACIKVWTGSQEASARHFLCTRSKVLPGLWRWNEISIDPPGGAYRDPSSASLFPEFPLRDHILILQNITFRIFCFRIGSSFLLRRKTSNLSLHTLLSLRKGMSFTSYLVSSWAVDNSV